MKKLFTTISMLLLTLCLFAQAPQKMNYQAVVRNASNSLVANQNVSVRLSVLQGAATGASVYTETHTVNTNANGLMTLELGAGNAQSGTFASIDWANGPYYLKSEVDPDGGVNYNVVSTQQLLSVPYALYAAASGNGATGPQGPAGPQGPQGERGLQGEQGEPGQDGVSPTITTTTTPTGTFVVISDANGNHQFFVSNGTDGATGPQGPQGERGLQGEQGEPGQDGYSPVVTITALDSMRTQVTITSEQHPDGQNFIVKNGSTGAAFVQDQADWLETNSSSNSYIVNKPDLSTVAITGNYNDLSNRPALSTVATTGSYNDLTGKPSMPAAANNATLTIQKNGAAVGTFSANASADKSINISVPTTTGELTNNSGFVSNSNCPTVNICDLQNTVADLQSAMNTMQTNMQATINTLQSTINTLQNTIANQNERIDSLRNAMSGGGPSISRPTVTTGSVSLITTTTASCEGYVTSDGGSDITERGVCYGTSQNPTVAGSKVTATGTTGSYSCNLTGLAEGTDYYVRAYATNSKGTAYGVVVSFTTLSLACTGTPTVTDVDGNTYKTVQIGDQCWMRENLRTTKYSDGTAIALGSSTSTSTAYRYNPNNNAAHVPTYGYLYNWKAVMRNSSSSSANPSGVQGVCPAGWHVPSDAEWTQLTDYVSSQSQYQCGGTSTSIAKALASTTGWRSSSETCAVGNNPSGNNATGFSALPAGRYYGSYGNFGGYAYFWSSTEYNSYYAYRRYLSYDYAYVRSYNCDESNGYSVRCLRNQE